ncbi:hypothetical protein OAK75_01680 [Bacteriovoracales bacterium]|nr:hypothetical protein [Bacteriovoracales bacterium]
MKVKLFFIKVLFGLISFVSFFVLSSEGQQINKENLNHQRVKESVFSINSFEHGVTANAFLVSLKKGIWFFTNAHVCGGKNQSIEKNKRYYFTLEGAKVSYYLKLSGKDIIMDKVNDLCAFPLSNKIKKKYLTFSESFNKGLTSEEFKMPTKFKGQHRFFSKVKIIDKDCTSIYSCERLRSKNKKRSGNMITDFKIKQGMSGSPILNKNHEIQYIAYGRLELTVGSFRSVVGLIQGGSPLKRFVEKVQKADLNNDTFDSSSLSYKVSEKENNTGSVVTI